MCVELQELGMEIQTYVPSQPPATDKVVDSAMKADPCFIVLDTPPELLPNFKKLQEACTGVKVASLAAGREGVPENQVEKLEERLFEKINKLANLLKGREYCKIRHSTKRPANVQFGEYVYQLV